ncbi:Leukocyte immunoglobulin-like receptor subfamily A member 6 [Myotis brandtii]|nr:Leukocyte immunoglobulin-like receptor subfamily A member 6 [Myotis brandtii]
MWTRLRFPFGGGATPTLPGGRGHIHTSLPSIPEASSQPGPRIMSLVLPTLLYLGNLPPPVITAQPGSMVLYNEPVTILCQGPPDAEAYEIYKVEEPESRDRRKLLVAGMTDTLYIQEMKPDQTGLYRCSYKSGEHWSLFSDPLRVVMTGTFDKPSLSSMSGTVVASGDNVKLQCFSRIRFQAFILTKEDAPQFTQRQSSTTQDNGVQTTFHMDHVTSTQAGTYRCYGAFSKDPYVWSHPSDPLQLVVRGSLPPPVITAQPGSMVLYNEPVTIRCQGPPDAKAYKIYKVEEPEPTDGKKLLVTGKTDTSAIQEMKPYWTGLYRCSYKSGGHWSPLSNILHLVMTGSYDKPSLSSMSGTVVAPGDNVTLQCFSRIKFYSFILTKEDAPQFTQRQSSTAQDNGQQTTFHMDHVTSTQAGTYRCYGAFNKDPYVWSHPSDPFQLVVRGPAGWSVSPQNQVRLSLAGLVLLVLVVLVAEACYSHKRSFYGLRSDPYLSIMTNTEDTRGF